MRHHPRAPAHMAASAPNVALQPPMERYDVGALASGTSGIKSRHSPGSPLKMYVPRSVKVRPDPATRSLTVLDTRTSPGWAICVIRKPVKTRSEEHTSELQSLTNLVCRLLLEKKKKK